MMLFYEIFEPGCGNIWSYIGDSPLKQDVFVGITSYPVSGKAVIKLKVRNKLNQQPTYVQELEPVKPPPVV